MKRPITPRGYSALRKELRNLKSQRPALAQAIETARAHGDLSENAEYHAAKEKSGLVEAKIRDIDSKLSLAEIIDPSKIGEPQRVVFGVSVVLEDVDSGEERRVALVGADESDADKGWVSIESPLGKSLIGKESGDIAKVQLPGGVREYEVMEISLQPEVFEIEES